MIHWKSYNGRCWVKSDPLNNSFINEKQYRLWRLYSDEHYMGISAYLNFIIEQGREHARVTPEQMENYFRNPELIVAERLDEIL